MIQQKATQRRDLCNLKRHTDAHTCTLRKCAQNPRKTAEDKCAIVCCRCPCVCVSVTIQLCEIRNSGMDYTKTTQHPQQPHKDRKDDSRHSDRLDCICLKHTLHQRSPRHVPPLPTFMFFGDPKRFSGSLGGERQRSKKGPSGGLI